MGKKNQVVPLRKDVVTEVSAPETGGGRRPSQLLYQKVSPNQLEQRWRVFPGSHDTSFPTKGRRTEEGGKVTVVYDVPSPDGSSSDVPSSDVPSPDGSSRKDPSQINVSFKATQGSGFSSKADVQFPEWVPECCNVLLSCSCSKRGSRAVEVNVNTTGIPPAELIRAAVEAAVSTAARAASAPAQISTVPSAQRMERGSEHPGNQKSTESSEREECKSVPPRLLHSPPTQPSATHDDLAPDREVAEIMRYSSVLGNLPRGTVSSDDGLEFV